MVERDVSSWWNEMFHHGGTRRFIMVERMSDISFGVIRQHPPIQLAPESIHAGM